MRPLILAIAIAGVLVLLFAMLVMYRVMSSEEAANSAVPGDENADQQHELFRDPPQSSSGAEPGKPEEPAKPERKPPLDEK